MLDRFALLETAEGLLSVAPALGRIERPVRRGDRVARFVLPLELCKPQNRKRAPTRGAQFLEKKTRDAVAQAMGVQVRPWQESLTGRPQVLCVRFSSVEPDPYSDWAKVAVDTLCAPVRRNANRLNIIRDDAPKHAEIRQWWEPAKQGQGFVYIEVWTG